MLHWIATSGRHFVTRRELIARRLSSHWLAWLVGSAAFLLYAYTSAPGIVTFFDDTLEFQTIAPTFGIAHPTGYPLYTILGGLWTHLLPWGTWAGRLNLFSALCAAIAVGLIAALGGRLLLDRRGAPNPWAALAAAITYALSPVWWSQATVAEVYPLHSAFVAAILATTIGINQTLTPHALTEGQPSPRFERRMTWLLLLFGLALAHHRTILLLAPPVALYVLWSVPGIWRPRRVWWRWGIALAAPLLLYLYIPLRAAAGVRDLNDSYVPGWAGFWNHVLAQEYTAFFADNPLTTTYTSAQWFELIRSQTGWIGLCLALMGLVWLFDRRGRPARPWWLLLGVLLINLLFAILYRVPDPEVFLLPTILALALFSGAGVGLLARWLSTPSATLLSALLVGLLIFAPLERGPGVNRRNEWSAHDQARRMAQATFPPNSQVIGLEGEMTALRYMQAAEALGTNATPITANESAQRRALVDALMARGTPVFLTRELEGIQSSYSFSGEADLVRVWPRGGSQVTLPDLAISTPPLLLDEGRVQIEAYTLRPITDLAQPAQELTLYWRLLSPTEKVLKLSLRLLDGAGAPLQWPDGRAAVEDRFPLHQAALTPDWFPDELIQDVHTVLLPPALQEKSATLLVIIYESATALEEGRIEIMF
ncbi:MAG: DUF2723 domain-containing protein [Caldilineaceae bacterium]|nr:DUF2723 domain-containing protein [Caldilineaceae bacterium]